MCIEAAISEKKKRGTKRRQEKLSYVFDDRNIKSKGISNWNLWEFLLAEIAIRIWW